MAPQIDDKIDQLKRLNSEKVENISDLVGSWGPLQKRIFGLLCIVYCAAPFNNASLLYYVLKSDLWCEKADGQRVTLSPDKCSFKELKSCSSWGHNTTRVTVTAEWNLICEDVWLRSLTLSAYQIGYLFSGIVIGLLSDRYGRKTAIILCIIEEIIVSICLIFAPNVYVFIGLRIIHGIGGFGRFLACLILVAESVGPELRGRIIVCYDWIWYGGDYIMMIIAYNVSSFRTIYTGSAIFQIFCLVIMVFVPESPRWQLVTGQADKAESVLREYSAKRSPKERLSDEIFNIKLSKLREHLMTNKCEETNQRMGIIDLWRQPRLSTYCFMLYICWFFVAFIAFGLKFSTLDLTGNVFVNNAILSIASISANAYMTWKVDSFQRRTMLRIMFFITSVLLFGSMFFVDSPDLIIPRMILIGLGRFFASAVFGLLYVYSPEVFPTNIRHLGVGTCSTAARVASISAPFIAQFTALVSLKLTYGLFALVAIIASGVANFLPETKNKEIPDTVEKLIEMHGQKV